MSDNTETVSAEADVAPVPALNIPADDAQPTPDTPEGDKPEADQQEKASAAESEAETTDETDETDDKPQRKKKSAQERIDQITAKRRVAEAERDAARQDAERLRRELYELQNTKVDDLDQQDANTMRQAVKEERLADANARAEQLAAQEAAAKQEAWAARVEQTAESMPDFNTVVSNPTLPISEAAAEFIMDTEKGPELAYYLGKNPDKAQALNSMSPMQQVAELARIEGRLQGASEVRKVSNAPTPPPKIGSSSPVMKDPSTMTEAEYIQWRRKGTA